MDEGLKQKLLNTDSFEEFKKIALGNDVTSFKHLSIRVLKHMDSIMSKNKETIENHSDPREAFIKR